MNILLWVLQAVLALFSLAGGAYKIFNFDAVAGQPFFDALPRATWSALGALEMACGVLLVVPAAVKRLPILTPVAAGALVLESLALGGVYARYSLRLTPANPLVWVLAIAVMAAFVAYGRYGLRPKR